MLHLFKLLITAIVVEIIFCTLVIYFAKRFSFKKNLTDNEKNVKLESRSSGEDNDRDFNSL